MDLLIDVNNSKVILQIPSTLHSLLWKYRQSRTGDWLYRVLYIYTTKVKKYDLVHMPGLPSSTDIISHKQVVAILARLDFLLANLHSPLRRNQDAQTLVDMIQIRQWYGKHQVSTYYASNCATQINRGFH